MAVTGNIALTVKGTQTGTAVLGKSPSWNSTLTHALAFTDGTTANKIDLLYMAERTVASATNDDIDLAGVLTDPLGNTLTNAELVSVVVINQARDGTANTTNLTIGGGTNAFEGFVGATGDTIGPVRPGGMFVICNPDASGLGTVTAGTADILRVANSSGASNTYQVAIFGRSA